MAEVVEELRVARPTDDVWAVLADFGAISRWAATVDHSCLTTARGEGVGAVRRVQVGRNALLERVVVWEPGRRLTYEIDGLPPVIRSLTNTWRIDDANGANAVVSLAATIDAGPRPPQQLAARAFGRALAKANRDLLRGLQTHLEEVVR